MLNVIAILALTLVGTEPNELQSKIHANARIALQNNAPEETIQLWFLRNAVESSTDALSIHDSDFHSLLWTSLSSLGLCTDGLARDQNGAGIWPVATHNLMLKLLRKPSGRAQGDPFRSFKFGHQQRAVSIYDVLNSEELRALKLRSGFCLGPHLLRAQVRDFPWSSNDDRIIRAIILKRLLRRALSTTANSKVRGQAELKARIFDLNLYLMDQQEKVRRRQRRATAQQGRAANFSNTALEDIKEPLNRTFEGAELEQEYILGTSVDWSTAEWLQIEDERRLFLFLQSAIFHENSDELIKRATELIDVFIERQDGTSLTQWIGVFDHLTKGKSRQELWDGARGRRIAQLTRSEGFNDRSVFQLHQGIAAVQEGNFIKGFSSFADAIASSTDSSAVDEVRALSLRWLNHTAEHFTLDTTLLNLIESALPKVERTKVLENLMWQAAWYGDREAYQLGLSRIQKRRASTERMVLIEPISRGDSKGLVVNLKRLASKRPSAALRLITKIVSQFERLDLERRTVHLSTLDALELSTDWIRRQSDQDKSPKRITRLFERMDAIRMGLQELEGQARANHEATPDSQTFIGAIKLAPADERPWPFNKPDVRRPNPFSPVKLRPREWRDVHGNRVMGWMIGS